MKIKFLETNRVFLILLFLTYPFLMGFTPRTETIGSGTDELTYQEAEASKYFQGDHAKRRLVARCYGAGAIYVGVVFLMKEPAGIKIYLPDKQEKRAAIFKIANEVLKQAQVRNEDDEGQETLMVWFHA